MALSEHRTYQTVGPVVRVPGKLDDEVTFYKGALLVFNASGHLTLPTNAAGQIPAGVWTGFGLDIGADSLTTAEDEHPDSEVIQGLVWVPFADASQANVGTLMYLDDDETVTATAGDRDQAVRVKAFTDGYLLVDFNTVYDESA